VPLAALAKRGEERGGGWFNRAYETRREGGGSEERGSAAHRRQEEWRQGRTKDVRPNGHGFPGEKRTKLKRGSGKSGSKPRRTTADRQEETEGETSGGTVRNLQSPGT